MVPPTPATSRIQYAYNVILPAEVGHRVVSLTKTFPIFTEIQCWFSLKCMSFVCLIKLIFVEQCFAHFGASLLKTKIENQQSLVYHSQIYVSARFVIFYQFIQKFYENNLRHPVTMKHHVWITSRKSQVANESVSLSMSDPKRWNASVPIFSLDTIHTVIPFDQQRVNLAW